MSFEKLKNKVVKTLNSVINNPMLRKHIDQSLVIHDAGEVISSGGPSVIVKFRLIKERSEQAESYWVLSCADHEMVTAETLKRLRESIDELPGECKKVTFITSSSSFTRAAVDFALKNSIGLARISPLSPGDKSISLGDVVTSISPLELKQALCDCEYGARRRSLYGFTTGGKIDHFGSLENYFRSELLNF